MGCGWTMPDVDLTRVDAIEVVNGGAARLPGGVDGPLSGARLWAQSLVSGRPITAVGGSDNHDALQPVTMLGGIGRPTTVVRAAGLNQAAILAGIRSGRVFIDMEGRAGSMLDLRLSTGDTSAAMGSALRAAAGDPIIAHVEVRAAPGGRLDLMAGDAVIASVAIDGVRDVDVPIDRRDRPLIVHAVVRAADGSVSLISNAVRISAAE